MYSNHAIFSMDVPPPPDPRSLGAMLALPEPIEPPVSRIDDGEDDEAE